MRCCAARKPSRSTFSRATTFTEAQEGWSEQTEDTPVVLDFYAQRAHPDTFGKWWERDRKLLGLDGWCLHELRHSYLSMLAQQGVHPKVMQELAGHASATITMDIYTHVNMDQKREAADVMEDAFQSIGAEEEFMAKRAEEEFMAKRAEDAPKAAPTRSATFARHAAREHRNKPRYKPRNDSYQIRTSSPTAPSSK